MNNLIRKLTVSLLSLSISSASLLCMLTVPASADTTPSIILSGTAHVQDYGDVEGKWDSSTSTLTLGTHGESKRVESITINMQNQTGLGGDLIYRVHVQDYGWQNYVGSGEAAGTRGESKRLEGIEMELTDSLKNYFTVQYSVHIQDYGDAQGWQQNGALAGTTGESKRLEEVRIRIVPTGNNPLAVTLSYRTHVQDYGWENSWKNSGEVSGTTGSSKRLEAISISLGGAQADSGIRYRTYVQDYGWTDTATNGEMAGTQGKGKRLEAIQIEADSNSLIDIYYRVHAQDYGWLGWAKNGGVSGTMGLSKRLEAIQIVIVPKGNAAPTNYGGIESVTTEPLITSPEYSGFLIRVDKVTFTDTSGRNRNRYYMCSSIVPVFYIDSYLDVPASTQGDRKDCFYNEYDQYKYIMTQMTQTDTWKMSFQHLSQYRVSSYQQAKDFVTGHPAYEVSADETSWDYDKDALNAFYR
ncbi:MAG: hypothetical protein LKF32_02355 [Mageeibacillus sp.]|nr:hypothetical protein [Mageeibacillus sp.]MCI1264703.1 hypothetical protein [Saccharofermentans sp.]MCI1770033.1 hypothetical protein [Mageeibacillus sp.]MCI2043902.1 hypothetical protein [Mageeibacillus sp.]